MKISEYLAVAAIAVVASAGTSLISGLAGDLQAQLVEGCPPEYSVDAPYNYGNTVFYQGAEYKCMWGPDTCGTKAPGQTDAWQPTYREVSTCYQDHQEPTGDAELTSLTVTGETNLADLNATGVVDLPKLQLLESSDIKSDSSTLGTVVAKDLTVTGELQLSNNDLTPAEKIPYAAGGVTCPKRKPFVVGLDMDQSPIVILCANL